MLDLSAVGAESVHKWDSSLKAPYLTVPDLCSRNKAISNLEKKRKKKKKEEEEKEEEEGPYGRSFLW
ncbi:hypothetical protein INR49_009003, partial [Caranx melampygus]